MRIIIIDTMSAKYDRSALRHAITDPSGGPEQTMDICTQNWLMLPAGRAVYVATDRNSFTRTLIH